MLKEILLSQNPSELIRLHKQDIYKQIPELQICDGFNQHNVYHVFDVLEHILHVVDKVSDNYLLRIAALFHDIGKPESFTLDENGIGHFYGHWNKSNELFDKYKDLFDLKPEEIELIKKLIFYHDLNITDANINMFEETFGFNIDLLLSLKRADILAQNPIYADRLNDLQRIESILKSGGSYEQQKIYK